MTQLRQAIQALVSEDSEEFDMLLEKKPTYKLKKVSSYNLEKIPGVVTPAPEGNKESSSNLKEDLKKTFKAVHAGTIRFRTIVSSKRE